MTRLLKGLWHICAVLGIVTVVVGAWFAMQGISARAEPSALEVSVARAARRMAIPASARSQPNPIPSRDERQRSHGS